MFNKKSSLIALNISLYLIQFFEPYRMNSLILLNFKIDQNIKINEN